jgi:hypothetical protein
LAALAGAWVLWTQTRTSEPPSPITDAWAIMETFETQAECERARAAIDPPGGPEAGRLRRTYYVCFPDTLDPRATP